jgi:hypothetical protein
LNGVVAFERPGVVPPDPSWSMPITVELCSGGVNAASYFTTTDETGHFSVKALSGSFDVYVKSPHTLANWTSVVIPQFSATSTVDFGTLDDGDANGDNLVTSTDFFILKSTYNLAEGDPGYDSRADFNADHIITSVDFFILRNHYNQAGQSCESSDKQSFSDPEINLRAKFELPPDSLSIQRGSSVITRAGTLTYYVVAHAGVTEKVSSADIHIDFDPSKIRIDKVSGLAGESWIEMQNAIDNKAGTIDFSEVTLNDGYSGDFAVCSIILRSRAEISNDDLFFVYEPQIRRTRIELDDSGSGDGSPKLELRRKTSDSHISR